MQFSLSCIKCSRSHAGHALITQSNNNDNDGNVDDNGNNYDGNGNNDDNCNNCDDNGNDDDNYNYDDDEFDNSDNDNDNCTFKFCFRVFAS